MTKTSETHTLHSTKSFENRDEFKRKPVAEKLIRLLNSDVELSQIAIDGPWGSGKTEFCEKLIHLVESKPDEEKLFKPVYFDAYLHDHADDPFAALAAAIISVVGDKDLQQTLRETAAKVGTTLARGAAQILLKPIIGADGYDALKDAASQLTQKEAKDALSDHLSQGMVDTIASFETLKHDIDALKAALGKAASDRKIVIFIDELDRCRPTFAMALLERVKHMFEIPNVQFVFLTHMNQLAAIVKKQYGHEIDADLYLEKFFHFRTTLSDTQTEHGNRSVNSFQYFLSMCREREGCSKIFAEDQWLTKLYCWLFETDKRSLREAELLMRNIEIYDAVTGRTLRAYAEGPYYRFNFFHRGVGIYIHTFYPEFSNVRWQDFTAEIFEKFINSLIPFDEEFESRHKGQRKYKIAMILRSVFYIDFYNEEPKHMETLGFTGEAKSILKSMNEEFGSSHGEKSFLKSTVDVIAALRLEN